MQTMVVNDKNQVMLPEEVISNKIFLIRNIKVMLDKDLAELYGVLTGNLNKAVKRNIKRFPGDFMFQLTKKEFDNLIFQFGTASWGGTRNLPFAFTEQGVAMLSGILNSERACLVNTFLDHHHNFLYLSSTVASNLVKIRHHRFYPLQHNNSKLAIFGLIIVYPIIVCEKWKNRGD